MFNKNIHYPNKTSNKVCVHIYLFKQNSMPVVTSTRNGKLFERFSIMDLVFI